MRFAVCLLVLSFYSQSGIWDSKIVTGAMLMLWHLRAEYERVLSCSTVSDFFAWCEASDSAKSLVHSFAAEVGFRALLS